MTDRTDEPDRRPRVSMRLVIDASTLVAEALRARGRRLLSHPNLDLVVAVDAWDETEHELRQRVGLLADRTLLEAATASKLLDEALEVIRKRVAVVPATAYADRLAEARRRVPQDERDAPTVALALTLDCGIWTGDRDFFGCGLPVWTTDTLLHHLEFLEGRL